MERAASGAGVLTAPNSSLAGVGFGLAALVVLDGAFLASRLGPLAVSFCSGAVVGLASSWATRSADPTRSAARLSTRVGKRMPLSKVRAKVPAGRAYPGPRRPRQPDVPVALSAAANAPAASAVDATAFQPAKDSPRKRQEATPQLAGTRSRFMVLRSNAGRS